MSRFHAFSTLHVCTRHSTSSVTSRWAKVVQRSNGIPETDVVRERQKVRRPGEHRHQFCRGVGLGPPRQSETAKFQCSLEHGCFGKLRDCSVTHSFCSGVAATSLLPTDSMYASRKHQGGLPPSSSTNVVKPDMPRPSVHNQALAKHEPVQQGGRFSAYLDQNDLPQALPLSAAPPKSHASASSST